MVCLQLMVIILLIVYRSNCWNLWHRKQRRSSLQGGLNVWEIRTSEAEMFSTAATLVRLENSKDPRIHITEGGERMPYAVMYANWMQDTIEKYDNEDIQISSEMMLAAECLQLNSWKVPRDMYEKYFITSSMIGECVEVNGEENDFLRGRDGYFEWKVAVRKFAASRAAYFIREGGLSAPQIQRVERFICSNPFEFQKDDNIEEEAALKLFAKLQREMLYEYAFHHMEESQLNEILWYDYPFYYRNIILPNSYGCNSYQQLSRLDCTAMLQKYYDSSSNRS